jgi:3',5'-cyclic AMP phosphodiesterase CpdA
MIGTIARRIGVDTVMTRRIFIGDVQGCREELARLLEACAFAPPADHLCMVGDLVNKGPDSDGVVRLARQLDATVVLGNHDLWWIRHGRGDDELRDWLARRPFIATWDDAIMVHAGLHPAWDDAALERLGRDLAPPVDLTPPLSPEMEWLVTVRYCDPAGNRPASDWPPPPPPFAPWDVLYRGRRTVVFGHWARRGLVVTPRVRGLDTGCVYGGKLSAWIAEEDRIVQVQASRAYRPVR